MRDLNPRHPACKADTLTAELIVQNMLSELRFLNSMFPPDKRKTLLCHILTTSTSWINVRTALAKYTNYF